MGTTQAMGFAAAVRDGEVSLDAALDYHLTANHYPPVPRSMIGPCAEAIRLAEAEEWDAQVELPEGVTWRGRKTVPVGAMIENFHLQAFVASGDEGAEVDYQEEE